MNLMAFTGWCHCLQSHHIVGKNLLDTNAEYQVQEIRTGYCSIEVSWLERTVVLFTSIPLLLFVVGLGRLSLGSVIRVIDTNEICGLGIS